jgi:hypothetical protein
MLSIIKVNVVLLFIFNCIWAQSLSKYEPATGCYLGAFILNDVKVSGQIGKFESVTGKKHTGYLTYTSVSSPFPKAFVDSCRKYNAFMQLGFEPDTSFRDVIDGPHLRNWAKAAARSGIPIFLRFASEMNGDWVPWFGPPSLYKEKWKLMHRIMKEEAPNVAMVWCPNWRPDIPGDSLKAIMPYYPGDEYVDWVGVNFYMWGPYYDSVMNETYINTLHKLKSVYDKFPNKPIMICEWGAASKEYRGAPPLPKNTAAYAIGHIQQLYNSLKTQFPRVKGIFYFDWDSNAINKSDFSLTNDTTVLNTYRSLIKQSHFISNVNQNVPLISIPFKVLKGVDTLAVSISSSRPIDKAVLYLRGQLISTLNSPPWNFSFDYSSIVDGEYEAIVRAYTIDNIEGTGYRTVVVDNNNDYFSSVVDNSDSNFTGFGGWNSSSQPDRYGVDYYVIPANSSAYGEWKFSHPDSRNVHILAMWSEHSNRSSNAKYVIYKSSGDSIIVTVNQKLKGGIWNFLHEVQIEPNSEIRVKLLSSNDGFCIADAINFYQNTTTNVENFELAVTDFKLYQNYPNPFNPSTVISYQLSAVSYVTLKVYDILGREIATLVEGVKEPGTHNSAFHIPNSTFSSGVYFYQLRAGNFVETKKMIVIK